MSLNNRCVDCGSPCSGRTCSMCYGDIDHGEDGYYREWAEDQQRQQEERAREQAEAENADPLHDEEPT